MTSLKRYNWTMAIGWIPKKRLADLGLVYCAVVWGSTFVMVKGALDSVGPAAMVGIRFLISALLLLPWVLRRPDKTALLKESFMLSLLLSVLYLSQTTGLLYTTASNSGFITGLFILFIPVFMFLLRGEKPSRFQGVSAGLAVLGMWFLTGGLSGFNRGDALTLIAAAVYSAHLIFTDKYVKAGADTLMLVFHQFWMISLISFAAAAVSGSPLWVSDNKAWGSILFLAAFPTLSAYYIQMLAQKESDPFKVGIIFTLEPVFAAVFAWTLGGERFSAVKAAGGFLIVSGMVVSELSKLRPGAGTARS